MWLPQLTVSIKYLKKSERDRVSKFIKPRGSFKEQGSARNLLLLDVNEPTDFDFVAKEREAQEKAAFADILKRISKIQKNNGQNYVVLR
ncbi:Transcription initiation factor IIF subunit alpha [Platanthera guangdongensis]|uniref:Transcription initiation factor IIF subunit alpha n=1 Tax=Platanthera guangdongensis TaxID=2320717 RepID=A0ABR2LCW4_9ASPA